MGCLIVIIILALVGFGAYKGMQFYSEIDGGTDLGAEQTVSIEQGSSVSSIATQLKDAGIIQYDWLFKQYAKYSGKADGIQYGDFTLRSGMSYNDIIKTLSEVVRRATTNVTIPEGTTAVGVARSLWMPGWWTMWTPSSTAPTAPTAPISASMISGTRSPITAA